MRLTVLDSFRGLFATMIVFLHVNYDSHIFQLNAIRNSGVFVDFFFVLSGFVISMAYLDKVKDKRSLAAFLVRRIGRLWPLHAVLACAFTAMTLSKVVASQAGIYQMRMDHTIGQEFEFLTENLLFLQSFRNENIFWLNFPSWSISAEFIAYVLFGVFCLIGEWMMLAVGLFLLSTALAIWNVIDLGIGHTFDNGVYRAICYFLLGHLCYRIWQRYKLPKTPAFGIFEIVLVPLILLQLYLSNEVRFTAPILFAAAILVFATEAGPVSRLLKTPPFLSLGTWSYSIYMVHAIILAVVALMIGVAEKKFGLHLRYPNPDRPDELLIGFGSPWLMDAMHIGVVCVTIAMASLTYRFIERPCNGLAGKIARRLDRGSGSASEATR